METQPHELTQEQQQLANDNLRLAFWYANKWHTQATTILCRRDPFEVMEELKDACIDGLLRAARAFDPAVGATFAGFAVKCMDYQVSNYLRGQFRHKRAPMEALDDNDQPIPRRFERDVIGRILIEQALDTLEGPRREAFSLLLHGEDRGEIARTMGLRDTRAADNLITRAREQLRPAFRGVFH
jgi:RNA polymerase sigma factor (sigma-70 family)